MSNSTKFSLRRRWRRDNTSISLLSASKIRSSSNNGIAFIRRDELLVSQILGEGGFAQVFEVVRHPLLLSSTNEAKENAPTIASTSHRFAMKIVRKKLIGNKDIFRKAANDLVNEANILSMLDHPNILKLRALSSTCGRPYRNEKSYDEFFLVTDRLMETLADRIQRWKIERIRDNRQAKNSLNPLRIDYALQIAKALEYLHGHRIVMRDVKPENIGFISQHTLQLFDFGLSREIPSSSREAPGEETYKMTICGTQRYLPKEVLLHGRYNLKCDVYSWAMVFWEILTHKKPFHYMTPSVLKILVCERGERPPLSRHCFPSQIRDLLNMTWADDVEDRLNMTQVCERLHLILKEMNRQPHDGQCSARVLVDWGHQKTSVARNLYGSHGVGIEVTMK